jgi:hypothetical protein
VEFVPKALVVGVFAPVQPAATALVTEEKINRVWAEVAPRQGYRQLQIAPDGSGAQFLGNSPEDGATIQPPLLQVRSSIETTATKAADEAQGTLRAIAKHLGLTQFFNLGVKHVYHAPIPTNDARGFVLRNLLQKTEDDVGVLERGGSFWGGVKYGAPSPDGAQFVLTVEPWLADDRFLFVDLDAQFPGLATLEGIKERAREAEEYLSGAVKEYLDSAGPGV